MGHNSKNTFRRFSELQIGNEIEVKTTYGEYKYKVQNIVMNFKNNILRVFDILIKHCRFKSLNVIIGFLMLNFCMMDDKEYNLYSRKKAVDICNQYVFKQKLFSNEKSKNIVDKWSSRYFQKLNEYIRGLINPPLEKIREYEEFRKDLSAIIESTSELEENTILFRGEKEVDVESRFRVGRINIFSGFISTSFECKTAINFSKTPNNTGFLIIIKAKKNTKGIAINGVEIGSFKHQHEWLLNENQRYITNKVDMENRIIEIELL